MSIILNVGAYIFKNLGFLVGIVESILKVIAGIVSVTPTKKDDEIYAKVDGIFSTVKKWLYTISDNLVK